MLSCFFLFFFFNYENKHRLYWGNYLISNKQPFGKKRILLIFGKLYI